MTAALMWAAALCTRLSVCLCYVLQTEHTLQTAGRMVQQWLHPYINFWVKHRNA